MISPGQINIKRFGRKVVTGRDISLDFEKLQNIDEKLSTMAIKAREERIPPEETFVVAGTTVWSTRKLTVEGKLIVADDAKVFVVD